MKVCVVGGGAAGFFSAVHAKSNHPDAEVTILEKTSKLLSKVRISGGGRCNVTNGASDIDLLCQAYPRGRRLMQRALWTFNTPDIIEWFESRGVPLYTQDDGRVFPRSDDSASIVDLLMGEVKKLGIPIETSFGVDRIEQRGSGFVLHNKNRKIACDKVIIASGGSPKASGFEWLSDLGHQIEEPVPSLFTFNMPGDAITDLSGVVAPHAEVAIRGTKFVESGPLLITHWGMSGPAVLKLSAFAARELAASGYEFDIRVNWSGVGHHEAVRDTLSTILGTHQQKSISNFKIPDIPRRLWHFLLKKAGLSEHAKPAEMGKKSINKLVDVMTHDVYHVSGKTTFKEEFVTCGGVSLKDVDWPTMESKVVPGMYFAGEVLDVDGITGGYNFQAAWTTAYIAGQLNGKELTS